MDSATLSPAPRAHPDGAAAIVRTPHLAGLVVFTDGLPGCGKTMMAPIIGSLGRVELMRYNYALEHLCGLRALGALDPAAAAALIRLQTDLDLYDSMMARETNFRFTDLSSAWRDARPWRYLRRLVQAGDAAVLPRIQQQRPILHLVTHLLLGLSEALFDGLGERLRIVEVVRHPLYMVKQWYAWMPRAGVDPRFFSLWIEHAGHSLPWFARGWEPQYLRANRMDRVLLAIESQWRQGLQALAARPEAQRRQVLIIPFERFVVRPAPFMAALEALLGTTVTPATRRVMRQQRVPRTRYAEGIGLKIYRQYGWQPPARGTDERGELAARRAFVAAEATSEVLARFDRLCAEYEAAYLPCLEAAG